MMYQGRKSGLHPKSASAKPFVSSKPTETPLGYENSTPTYVPYSMAVDATPEASYLFYQKAVDLENKMESRLLSLADKISEHAHYKQECQSKDYRIMELSEEVEALKKEIGLLMQYKEKVCWLCVYLKHTQPRRRKSSLKTTSLTTAGLTAPWGPTTC
jgi:hypothetical protein